MAEIKLTDYIGKASFTLVLDDTTMKLVSVEVSNESDKKLKLSLIDKDTKEELISRTWDSKTATTYNIASVARPSFASKVIDKIDKKVTTYILSRAYMVVAI